MRKDEDAPRDRALLGGSDSEAGNVPAAAASLPRGAGTGASRGCRTNRPFCSWVTLLRKTVLISLADERAEKLMEPLPGEPGSEEGETWGLPRHQRLRKALLGMLEQPQDTPGAAGVDGHKLLAIAQHIENAVGTRQLQARGEGGGSSFCRRGERATGSRSVPLPPQAPFVCPPPPQEDLQALLKLPGPGDPPPDGAKPEWRKQLNRRIALLRGIPFRAILTTNFTDVFGYGQELTGGAQDLVTALRGRVEAEEAFRSSLEAIDDRRCGWDGNDACSREPFATAPTLLLPLLLPLLLLQRAHDGPRGGAAALHHGPER